RVSHTESVTSVGRHAAGTDRVVVVDLHVRTRDGTVRNAPGVEDAGVVAIVHQVLDGVGHGLLQRAAFDQGDAIGRDAAGLAPELHLAAAGLHLVISDRLVDPHDVGTAGKQGRVGVGLLVEAADLDVLLAGRGAVVFVTGDGCPADLLAHETPGVALLGGAGLHRHRVATHVGRGVDRRPTRLHDPGF